MYTPLVLFVYNFLQLIALPLVTFFLVISLTLRDKHRGRILSRLGFKKNLTLPRSTTKAPVIWVHALSVGEVTSAVPLVRYIHTCRPDIIIIFSVTTSAGRRIADTLIAPHVTRVIDGPIDTLVTVTRFIRAIKPSIFVLVETDFWPNWLTTLHFKNIPTVLVNGRISEKSWKSYTRLRFFFRLMFRSFSFISMQSKQDGNKMTELGVEPGRIAALGNLKYDTALYLQNNSTGKTLLRETLQVKNDTPIWICGSTHAGEEKIIFDAFTKIRSSIPELLLIVVPRNIERASEISTLGKSYGLSTALRSREEPLSNHDILLVDTIGELVQFYGLADIAFVGGSLVAQGGHNPLEPAARGVPVIFGPHMEDFSEIGEQLTRRGVAVTVEDVDDLVSVVSKFLRDKQYHDRAAAAAVKLINENSGVAAAHLEMLEKLLPPIRAGRP